MSKVKNRKAKSKLHDNQQTFVKNEASFHPDQTRRGMATNRIQREPGAFGETGKEKLPILSLVNKMVLEARRRAVMPRLLKKLIPAEK